MSYRFDVVIRLLLIYSSVLLSTRTVVGIDFVHDVVPILKRNCTHCHAGRESEGDFSFNTRASVLDSGMVETEDPGSSHLLELIESDDPDLQMPPPDRPRLSAEEILVLRRWVLDGLAWEADFTFAIDAYEPPLLPRSPDLPAPRNGRTHPIDRILDHYLRDNDQERPQAIGDTAFLRRTSLDLIGLLPTPEQLDAFLLDEDPRKRERWIDSLLSNRIGYADHWLTFFNDLLRNDYSGTGFITGGRKQVSQWLYQSLLDNKPFDLLARELIAPPNAASQGYIDGIKWRGEVSAGQTLPIQFSQSISQSFLGINMKCASCHDSFIDRWTLKDAYGLAAIYSDDPLELHRCDKPTGDTAKAAWLFPELGAIDANATRQERLQQLSMLMTNPRNGRFARTIVNRLWYQLMGRGIVHPLDAMQSRPWNEDLLDYLADDLVKNQFNLKLTLRRIATSQAYQSEAERSEDDNRSDAYVYRGPKTKRMTAEQFLDNVWQICGDAPVKFDAPVIRSDPNTKTASTSNSTVSPSGKWIWGSNNGGAVPGQETLVLRKSIELPDNVMSGGAVISCDNEFELFVNGKWAASGNDWTKPQSIALLPLLKKGSNTIQVVAMNASNEPNPAGLYLEAHLKLQDGSTAAFATDSSWQYTDKVPKTTNNRLGRITGKWQDVSVVETLSVWDEMVAKKCVPLLLAIEAGGNGQPMVRASLLKNTALMKSLGRPMREQIVSMRPTTVTTLEAIDLANESTLASSFASGAERLIRDTDGDPKQIIELLFRKSLARSPTSKELDILIPTLGSDPDQHAVQDLIWAVCMLPEFFLIR